LAISQDQVLRNRRNGRTRTIYKVLLVWLLLMAAIFGLAHWRKQHAEALAGKKSVQAAVAKEQEQIDANDQFVAGVLPLCRETLAAFLATDNNAQRLPLVLPHPEIAEHMERYYAANELIRADPQTMILAASTLVELPEGKCVLTQWETPEGALFDAAFRQLGDRWALDWHHFVRYSELSWAMFLAGSGDEDIAEFRLLARRRLASEEDPRNGIGVVLSAPMRRHMEQEGFSQAMAGLSLNDRDGKLLQAAFQNEVAGFPLFGAKFRDINPEGMIRVRVRVQRMGEDGGNHYRIAEVVACHWYDSAATGIKAID